MDATAYRKAAPAAAGAEDAAHAGGDGAPAADAPDATAGGSPTASPADPAPASSSAPEPVAEAFSQQTLSRDSIAYAALALADETGFENVSMRKLAALFDKSAMALYRYYNSVDEIRAAAVDLAFMQVDCLPIPGERWDDTVRRTTRSIRDVYLQHARANFFLVPGYGDSPAMVEHTRRIYALHEGQGWPADVLRKAWRIIDAYLGGFLAGELAEMGASHTSSAESWGATVAGAYSEEAFNDGIEIIIAGIRQLAAPDACDWRTPE